MNSEYDELSDHYVLLSPDVFDEPIAEIFRHLLDTRLVEARRAHHKSEEYKKAVLKDRLRLDPFSDLRLKAEPEKAALTKAQDEREKHKKKYDYLQRYLYWFDARADRWAHSDIERLPPVHISSEKLRALLVQVERLKDLLTDANKLGSYAFAPIDYPGVEPARHADSGAEWEAKVLVELAHSLLTDEISKATEKAATDQAFEEIAKKAAKEAVEQAAQKAVMKANEALKKGTRPSGEG